MMKYLVMKAGIPLYTNLKIIFLRYSKLIQYAGQMVILFKVENNA